MTWCDDKEDGGRDQTINKISSTAIGSPCPAFNSTDKSDRESIGIAKACSSCGHQIRCPQQATAAVAAIHDLPGLPAGVKFDPTDQELLEHLEGKVGGDAKKLHPLIDEFIPTLEGENGICYTHPERLPGVTTDGLIRHFFHRPSKAYTTGTRKRRKVHSGGDVHGGETRWHKTGKTRPVLVGGRVKGFKKILVLYTNYGKRRKPEKTNWVMHQYHLGLNEEEKEGELVVSKVFYQTQPRQCGGGATKDHDSSHDNNVNKCSFYKSDGGGVNGQVNSGIAVDYYGASPMLGFGQHVGPHSTSPGPPRLIPNFTVHGGGPSFLP